jgi:hypothetical protein
MLSKIRHWFPGGPRRQALAPRPSTRPQLEALEARAVPCATGLMPQLPQAPALTSGRTAGGEAAIIVNFSQPNSPTATAGAAAVTPVSTQGGVRSLDLSTPAQVNEAPQPVHFPVF